MARLLKPDEIHQQLGALRDWQWDGNALHQDVEAPTFPIAIQIVDEIAGVAEQMDHHPDITIRWKRLTFALSTHSAGGVTQLDIELAHRIN